MPRMLSGLDCQTVTGGSQFTSPPRGNSDMPKGSSRREPWGRRRGLELRRAGQLSVGKNHVQLQRPCSRRSSANGAKPSSFLFLAIIAGKLKLKVASEEECVCPSAAGRQAGRQTAAAMMMNCAGA